MSDYNPYQEYNNERIHQEPERDPNGHPLPPSRPKPNNLAKLSLSLALASIFLCCCSMYAGIGCSIMSITLAVCSRFYNNEEKIWYPQAVAGLVIGIIVLILLIGSIIITYVLVPYLIETYPEFEEYYNQLYKTIFESLQQMESQSGQ